MNRIAILACAFFVTACGKEPTPAPATKPAPAPETKPAAAPETKPAPEPETKPAPEPETKPVPEPETKPAPEPVSVAFLAWYEDADSKLTTKLLVPGADGALSVVGTRADAIVAVVDGKVWSLGRDLKTRPLKPCGDDGEASFVELALTGLDPAVPAQAMPVGDTKTRPPAGESAIHVELLSFLSQVGPFVFMEHEANSDTCPVPAGGATYDAPRVLDLRDGSLKDPLALFTDAERAAMEATAIDEGVAKLRVDYPDVPADEIKKVMKLYDLALRWDDSGALVGEIMVAGASSLFSQIVDEEETVSTIVALKSLPSAIGTPVSPPPAVVEVWKAGGKYGRGWGIVVGTAIERLRPAFTAP